MNTIIGIDLGTTHSLAAVWKDGAPVLIPNALGEFLTPSCVGIDDDGSVLVGRAALHRLHTHPDLTAANFKRYMGTARKLRLGQASYRPEELSSFVLRALKADAQAYLGHPVEQAVITVPAYFNDTQRKATRAAGDLAGLNVARLINEPTAAALAYGVHERAAERKFLIFDLGGGTFDVSIIDIFEGVMEIRASAGDNMLGGEDFTGVLVDAFLARHRLDAERLRAHPVELQRLLHEAESAKRALTAGGSAQMRATLDGTAYEMAVTSAEFETLCTSLLDRLRQPVTRALRDARIPLAELKDVILVGGATRMPVVRRMASLLFGRLPAGSLNPDEAVALGAAVQAGLKQRDAALEEIVMTDVAPYSLGVEVATQVTPNHVSEGSFLPLIERNTTVPASRAKTVYTMHDNQTRVNLKVYQGESHAVADNILLGRLPIDVPAAPAGSVKIEVRFTYDVNGLLEVIARQLPDGQAHTLVIEENPGVLSPDEIAARLQALNKMKIHPRETTENRTLLARADRLFQELLGDPRHFIGQQIVTFQSVLETQDPETIVQAQAALKRVLEHFETRQIF
ncbi:molecular chaperone HscC [Burkholderia sp. 22PA0106]|uniref:molecular chaperone HscC n=1 Tax=Burkholderia sp. 22PA0106 TaxID=3237371 RepID=UPI0039C2FA9A